MEPGSSPRSTKLGPTAGSHPVQRVERLTSERAPNAARGSVDLEGSDGASAVVLLGQIETAMRYGAESPIQWHTTSAAASLPSHRGRHRPPVSVAGRDGRNRPPGNP